MPTLTNGSVPCECSSSTPWSYIGCSGGSDESNISVIKPNPPSTTVSICPPALVVDCTNKRVGINTLTPTDTLTVEGGTSITGDVYIDPNNTTSYAMSFSTLQRTISCESNTYTYFDNAPLSVIFGTDDPFSFRTTSTRTEFTPNGPAIVCNQASFYQIAFEAIFMKEQPDSIVTADIFVMLNDEPTYSIYSDNVAVDSYEQTKVYARGWLPLDVGDEIKIGIYLTQTTDDESVDTYESMRVRDLYITFVKKPFTRFYVDAGTAFISNQVTLQGEVNFIRDSLPGGSFLCNLPSEFNESLRVGDNLIYADAFLDTVSFGIGKTRILTVDTFNQRVGILKENPQATLDIDGEILVNGSMKAGELFFVDVPNNIIDISVPTTTLSNKKHTRSFPPKAFYVDATNARIGIGVTDLPQRTLDVEGDAIVRGSFWADTYENLPSMTPDILPITLDKTNNRVGINKTVPAYALDVTGDIDCTATYKINGMNVVAVSGNNTTIALGRTNTVAATSTSAVAIGYAANVGINSVSIGNNAASTSQGTQAVAVGTAAGRTSQGNYSVAIGNSAGNNAQASNCVAVGNSSGNANQSLNAVAVGSQAGNSSQGTYAVAIGDEAGKTGQGAYAVAIGRRAGLTNQHLRTICINGAQATLNTDRSDALFIQPIRNTTTAATNVLTYNTTTKEVSYGPVPTATPFDPLPLTLDKTNNRVGINTTFPPSEALDVVGNINCSSYKIDGVTAVYTRNNGTQLMLGRVDPVLPTADNAIAIGFLSSAGTNSVSIGYCAGRQTQGQSSVSIGYLSANSNQGESCVAIGSRAGNTGQGADAVAIGVKAGETNQHARTICINALETTALNTDRTDALFINPIRNTLTTPTNVLTYNTTTKEVTYGPLSSGSVGSSMMVTNQSLSCPVNQDVILTLPSTGSLVSTFSKDCIENTTAVTCAPMGVTYQKTGVIQFTQTGVYQFNLRTTKSGATTPGARLIAFIFRFNGVNVNNSDVQTFAANNDESELFINFSQYVDVTKVNELYYKYYNNNSASTIKFSVTITRIA